MRIVVEPRCGGRDADHGPAARRRAPCAPRPEAGMRLRFSVDLQADRQHRVERRHGLLEDHRDLAAAHAAAARAPACPAGRDRASRPSPRRGPAAGPGRRIERSVTLLPEPDSPTRPRTSPGPDVEVDAVDGGQRTARRGEAGPRGLGSRAAASAASPAGPQQSARPSPSRLKPRPVRRWRCRERPRSTRPWS